MLTLESKTILKKVKELVVMMSEKHREILETKKEEEMIKSKKKAGVVSSIPELQEIVENDCQDEVKCIQTSFPFFMQERVAQLIRACWVVKQVARKSDQPTTPKKASVEEPRTSSSVQEIPAPTEERKDELNSLEQQQVSSKKKKKSSALPVEPKKVAMKGKMWPTIT